MWYLSSIFQYVISALRIDRGGYAEGPILPSSMRWNTALPVSPEKGSVSVPVIHA
jgi:hypothetical protein